MTQVKRRINCCFHNYFVSGNRMALLIFVVGDVDRGASGSVGEMFFPFSRSELTDVGFGVVRNALEDIDQVGIWIDAMHSSVILLTIALRQQRPWGMTMVALQKEMGADFKTIRRWQAEYRQEFETGGYRLLRSKFCEGLVPGAEVLGMVSYFVTQNESESGVVRLLRFVAENEHLSPGR